MGIYQHTHVHHTIAHHFITQMAWAFSPKSNKLFIFKQLHCGTWNGTMKTANIPNIPSKCSFTPSASSNVCILWNKHVTYLLFRNISDSWIEIACAAYSRDPCQMRGENQWYILASVSLLCTVCVRCKLLLYNRWANSFTHKLSMWQRTTYRENCKRNVQQTTVHHIQRAYIQQRDNNYNRNIV